MEFPKISSNNESGGVFGNLKSRLGFGSKEDRDAPRRGYDNGDYVDEYDEYDDGYDDGYDDEYGDGYDDGYGEPASQYEPYAPVTTRSTGRSSYSSSPRLVTIDDVKSNTPDRIAHTSSSESRSGGMSNRVVIDNTAPAPSSPANATVQKERSEGLNSLFTPTAPAASAASSTYQPTVKPAQRAVKIIRPASYNDVAGVAKIVRAGDVVVLSLKATPEGLFNRVLDFSFGAASALDAHVDCVGAKVFAITTGAAMTDSEKAALKTQGVI